MPPNTALPTTVPQVLQQYDFGAQVKALQDGVPFTFPEAMEPQFAASPKPAPETDPSSGTVPADYRPRTDVPLTATALEAVRVSERWRAEKNPPAAGSDGRVLYSFGAGLPTVVCAPLRVCMIELQAGEKIVGEPQIGDSVRWNISPALYGTGNQATSVIVLKPQTPGLDTNLLVTTDRRAYYLRLISKAEDYVARVAFAYPDEDNRKWQQQMAEQKAALKQEKRSAELPAAAIAIEKINFGYITRGGNEHIRPLRVFDDGAKTYIKMPAEIQHREAPVLVVLGADGKGEMTNYRVREQTSWIVCAIAPTLFSVLARKLRKWRLAVSNPEHSDLNKVQDSPAAEQVRGMDAPDGLDLHPHPRKVVRISRRASLAIVFVVVGLLLAFAYGGYRRTQRAQIAAREAGLPKNVGPATQASAEFTKNIPDGTAPLANRNFAGLQPPAAALPDKNLALCGSNPQTGQPYRFNPQTGQPCDGLPQERVVVRQAPVARAPQSPSVVMPHEPTPEERRLAAAYAREQEARIAPTSIKSSAGTASIGQLAPNPQSSSDDFAQVAALTKAVSNHSTDVPSGDLSRLSSQTENEYDGQNMQTRKEAFLSAARTHQSDDYLRSTRDAPLSMFEIKAGWEIPAVLEQSLNSDLPGELKALVMASVYDTATGEYLLIPQGSRLIGKYDSRVAYGQDGVQVTWSRIIFPDASSIDLNGMVGLDSHGNAGLRDKVDRHYARIVGFSALTSLFTAAFEISQRRNQSVLAYPSPGEAASGAIGRELSQTGSQITRRNLNVQPTIKVPVGYKFTVRVNRDILFESPYQSMQADQQPLPSGEKQLRQRSMWGQR
ncbi:MAG: P-type conjugative transfer protein TrbG [Acidobacteriota bacterium]|nr:P-type conjugative transfer protein TrbG [Acidobacteriota bacterium]